MSGNCTQFRTALRSLVLALACCQTASAQDITTNLVHRWKFDEAAASPTFADDIGSNTATGVGTYTAGATGQIGSGVTIPAAGANRLTLASSISSLTGDLTVSAWIKHTAVGAQRRLLGTASNSNQLILPNTASDATWSVRAASSAVQSTTLDQNITAGTFYHYVIVRSGTTWTAYRNAVAQANTQTLSGTFTIDQLGTHGDSNSTIHGTMDELRIYTRALNQTDVTALYAYSGNTAPIVIHMLRLIGRVERFTRGLPICYLAHQSP